MKKNFSLNLLFLLLLNLLVKPIYVFGIEVGIQNEVGASEYGLYYAMFNFTFLFNVLLDMGINNYQKIKVAENETLGIDNMRTLLPLKLLLSFVYFSFTIAIALWLGFDGRYWFFIGWLMVNHVLSAFLLLLRANLSGLHLFFRDSVVSVIDRGLLVIAIGYLLWFSAVEFKIEYLVLFQTAAYSIAIVLALILTPAVSRRFKFNLNVAEMRSMITATWPFAVLIMLMTAYNKLDGVMLERLAPNGLLEAGIYAQAYRIIDAGNSFAFLYAGMLLPIFSRLIGQKQWSDLNQLISQGARFLVVPAGLAAIVVFFYSEWIMGLLYHQAVEESAAAFTWLMGSFLFISTGYVFGTILTAGNHLRLLNITAFAAVCINAVMNFILIPEMGAQGAAIASFTSLLVMTVAQFIVAAVQKELVVFGWIGPAIGCWIISISCAMAIEYFDFSTVNGLTLLSIISALAYVFICLKRSDLKTAIPSAD